MPRVAKVIVFVATLAASAALFSAPAIASRFGPRAILGLATLPFRIITHGLVRGGASHHLAHVASARAEVVRAGRRPAPHEEEPPPASPPAEPTPATSPAPAVVARTEPQPAAAPEQARKHLASPPTGPKPSSIPAPTPPWPAASPSVYEDLLGYVLWPNDYADQLWAHGYGDIMNVLMMPSTNADQAAGLIASGMCSSEASSLVDRLIAHTRESIAPDETQLAALDGLGAALREAITRGRTAVCTGAGDPLKRMVDGLWTMWDATLLMRPPLERFYNSLTDAQKAKLKGEAAAAQALARACTDQRPASPERLAQALGGGDAQRLTLETLRQHSAELTKLLAGSCPRGSEPTPLDRLDAARARMNTLLYVVISMSPTANELHQ